MKEHYFLLTSCQPLTTKKAGSGSGSQSYGSRRSGAVPKCHGFTTLINIVTNFKRETYFSIMLKAQEGWLEAFLDRIRNHNTLTKSLSSPVVPYNPQTTHVQISQLYCQLPGDRGEISLV